jgi:hypothetical protein
VFLPNPKPALENISLNAYSVTLSPNEEYTVEVTYTPENADIENLLIEVSNEELLKIVSISEDKTEIKIKAGATESPQVANLFIYNGSGVEADLEVNIE